ncbi:BglG family transcription antiterminator [Peribacillus simplex]|uniref:Ascorbate-specific PTS system EIIA component n=2 Tax=Peribacillus TaxID=2675229 RepID=A0AAN2TSE4_9BACI|nr:BglG family transcription antiterminator [Peribacillus simplex]CEG32142.1 phosphoenolpyruvate-dependent sugar phosphotransferase system, EIIA 2 [Peribacillus simplex]
MIDERSMKLLQEILNNQNTTLSVLESKLGINRRQINYSFEKINNWLSSLDQKKIERTKTGNFIVSSSLKHILPIDNDDNNVEIYIFSENERIAVILLMLLSRDEELSLIHLVSALGVGKNTVLRTIKAAQYELEKYQLKIIYSRQSGYRIQGKEFDKRRLLITVIQSIVSFYKGEKVLLQYSSFKDREVETLRKKLEQIEVHLSIKFTDERLVTLPYIIAVWINRVKQGKILEPNFNIDFSDLKETKEYHAVTKVFSELEVIPPKELLFLTLQLLTMNISSSQVLNDNKLSDLKSSLFEMVKIIENISAIDIPNKQELIDKLFLHVKPAYYRIKYNLGLMTSMFIKFDEKLEDLHEIVKVSASPIESLMGCPIPESESTFLTMIVGGWLTQHGVQLNHKKIAAVVCPNGVSVSKLLQVNLKSLFPEFMFLEAMSHREFSNYKGKIDVLFTTQRLPTDIKQYIVPSLINEREQNEIRKTILHEKYGLVPNNVDLNELIQVISKYAEVKDSSGLLKGLSSFFNKNSFVSATNVETNSKLTLKDLVYYETINIRDKVKDWKEALWFASEPLLKNNFIGHNYVEAMIEQYQNDSTYIMLAKNIAIPHSRPENDVYQVGMSFLKLNEPVEFEGGNFVKLICVIAAVDKEQHIRPILQLRRMAESQKDIQKIKDAETKKEIFSVIEKFSK